MSWLKHLPYLEKSQGSHWRDYLPMQPTVFCLPPGWMAQMGHPGKGCSAAETSSGKCQRSPGLWQKDRHRSMLVISVPSPLGTDPGYLLKNGIADDHVSFWYIPGNCGRVCLQLRHSHIDRRRWPVWVTQAWTEARHRKEAKEDVSEQALSPAHHHGASPTPAK